MSLLRPNNPSKKPIVLSNLFLIIVVLILLISNAYCAVKYFAVEKEFQQAQTAIETKQTQEQVLEFTKLFIEKVLKAEAEIDFETRLKLENSVRALGDEEVLSQWQKFVESKTEEEAQEEVKNLLEMLVSKI